MNDALEQMALPGLVICDFTTGLHTVQRGDKWYQEFARRLLAEQQGQEPVAEVRPDLGVRWFSDPNGRFKEGDKLYAAPPQGAKDAQRYRWLRGKNNPLERRDFKRGVDNGTSCYHVVGGVRELKSGEELDTAVDAAMNKEPAK